MQKYQTDFAICLMLNWFGLFDCQFWEHNKVGTLLGTKKNGTIFGWIVPLQPPFKVENNYICRINGSYIVPHFGIILNGLGFWNFDLGFKSPLSLQKILDPPLAFYARHSSLNLQQSSLAMISLKAVQSSTWTFYSQWHCYFVHKHFQQSIIQAISLDN